MEEEMYKKAYKELYTILEHTDEETVKQIPEKFMEFIKLKMNEEHEFSVNEEKSLSEQEILDETKHLLEIVRKKYLVPQEVQSPEIQTVAEETKVETEEVKETNNETAIEDNQELNVASIEENTEATGLIVVKPRNIFIRLIEKLKEIFVRSKGKVAEE